MKKIIVFVVSILLNTWLIYSQDATKISPVKVNEIIPSQSREYLKLSGTWRFQLDPGKIGEKEEWYLPGKTFNDEIKVPGNLEVQGKGLKYLPLAQPEWAGTCDKPWLGTSWYKKEFEVPKDFKGKNIKLNFGGVMTDCKVWLNGKYIGKHRYGNVPFGFIVNDYIEVGKTNVAVIRVDNQQTYQDKTPPNSHGFGVTVMEIRWSGIFRDVELVGSSESFIDDIYIIPDISEGKITCNYNIRGTIPENLELLAEVTPWENEQVVGTTKHALTSNKGAIDIKIKNPRLWFDHDPYLYTVSLKLVKKNKIVDDVHERFGLREITTDGHQIYLNGKPIYLRGDMCHIHWPGTVSPSTNRKEIKEKMQLFVDYGFNFIRHHTHFPGIEFMDVCDELGILNSNGINVVGGSMEIFEEDREILWQKLIERDRNHPSAIIWSMGNERVPTPDIIQKYSDLTFDVDQTRLLATNSPGWFITPERQKYRMNIHHEYRRAGGSYIDQDFKKNFKDSELRPWRVLYTEENLTNSGIDSLFPVFTKHTELLQARSRKLLLEQARLQHDEITDGWNIPGIHYVGYQLATFRDAGSFMWGVVDDYFNPKIVPPEDLRRYNAPTVLLWHRHWSERTFFTGNPEDRHTQILPIVLKCSHFGKENITNGKLEWNITDATGKVYKSGSENNIDMEVGELYTIATPYFFLPTQTDTPLTLILNARLTWDNLQIENEWDFWVFPRIVEETRNDNPGEKAFANPLIPVYTNISNETMNRQFITTYPFMKKDTEITEAEALYITDKFDEKVISLLEDGHRVLLLGDRHFDGHVTEWGAGRSEFARGTKIHSHPLMNTIPHEGWADLPFSNMISGDEPLHGNRNSNGIMMDMRPWPENVYPLVLGFPSYKDQEPQIYSYMLEVHAGNGKFITTTFDLSKKDPATRYFFDQVLRYMIGDEFDPKTTINLDFLKTQLERDAVIREHIIEFKKDGVMPNLKRPDEK